MRDRICGMDREAIQKAQEILAQEWSLSIEEANRYLYEMARARKLFLVEAADCIVGGEEDPAGESASGEMWGKALS